MNLTSNQPSVRPIPSITTTASFRDVSNLLFGGAIAGAAAAIAAVFMG